MAINNEPTIKPQIVTGIFTKYIAKTIPLAFDESMSYYECVCALLDYLNKTIVPDINNTNEGLSELQQFYLDLQAYVNDYFDRVFPLEITEQLDEMAENGTLENLLNDAAHLVKVYATYSDMIEDSENFTSGLKLRTLGYYNINDGGGSFYYVTNGTVNSNEYYVTLENTLKLVLINEEYDVYKVDCLGMIKSSDNLADATTTTTNTTILQGLIDFLEANNVNGIIKFSNGLYKLNPIEINFNVRICGELDNNDVAIEHSSYVGTTLLDMSDTTTPFITIEPIENRLWGVIIENLKIAGLYKHHDGVIIKKAGHVTRLSNVTIMRFLGYGLYLDQNNDSYLENVNIIECGFEDLTTLKYALNLSSAAESYTTTNAIHAVACHLEHCRYGINIDYATQIFFDSLKVETGNLYSGSYIADSDEPIITITDKAYQVNFSNCTFNAARSDVHTYYMMKINSHTEYNLRTRSLVNCNFTCGSNYGGQYIYVQNSNTQITNCSFTNISPTVQSVVFEGGTNDISNCTFNLINLNTSTSPYVVYIKSLASINNCTINSVNSSGADVYALNVTGGNKIGRINGLNGVKYLYNCSTNQNVEVESYDSLGLTTATLSSYGTLDGDGYYVLDFAKWKKPYHSILLTSTTEVLKIKDFTHFPLNYELIFVNNQNSNNVTLTQYGTLKLPNSTSSITLSGTGTYFKYLKTQSYGVITDYNTLT